MSMTDPLGDMLTRIRNGQQAKKKTVSVLPGKLHESVLEILKQEGYIRGYVCEEVRAGVQALAVDLKYHNNEPAIKKVQRVSTPGRRIYSGIKSLGPYYNGLGISILSTPRGVLSDHEARHRNVGGEVLCRVF